MRAQNRQEYNEAVAIVAWLHKKIAEAEARTNALTTSARRSLEEANHCTVLRVAASRIAEEFSLPDATDAQASAEVPAEAHESGWQWRPTSDDAAFAPPFGTIRVCRACWCLVAGGPTACVRCVAASQGGLSQALHDLVKER